MAPDGHSVDELLAQARADLSAASSTQELSEVRARYLGKKGSVSRLLRSLGKLDPAERRQRGQVVNAAKQAIEAQFAECRDALEGSARRRVDNPSAVSCPRACWKNLAEPRHRLRPLRPTL